MRNLLLFLLILAYLSTLAMSTGHLAQWYALTLGGLPPWLAWGLAASLEFTAFLLSLLSNSLLRGSAWAGGGALAALGLVWMGNALSMHRGAPGVPLWETLAMSLFVPVGTYVVGKVVGEMLRYRGGAGGYREDTGGVPQGVPRVGLPVARVYRKAAPPSGTLAPQGSHFAGVEDRLVAPGGTLVGTGTGTPVPGETSQTDGRTTLKLTESRTLEWTVEGKGAELLEALARYRGPVTLGTLVRDLGWPKTTVRRWLDRLEDQGLVHRTGEGWTLKEEGRYA
ncbi:helix-turn-helix domain-containing protein [Thermus brockianus]|uniref:DNA-binding transcriptional activator MhpR n=1 Tax=Thermus brockianus TaxID=56956 RepID=A0A1J0LXI5_THEBO|nr:helix-turn-helix domain-containing protein [Thermus brockianus]APD10189.1 DNA-binding transcriptional activator MhpR [Thermus brockianus]